MSRLTFLVLLILCMEVNSYCQNSASNYRGDYSRENAGKDQVDIPTIHSSTQTDFRFVGNAAYIPKCDKIYLDRYTRINPNNSGALFEYDPTKSVSSSNPALIPVTIPSAANGLAVGPVAGSSEPTPTFHTMIDYKFYYYNQTTSSWQNTNYGVNDFDAVNLCAGGGNIYSFNAINGIVYRFNGSSNAVRVLTLSGFDGPWDIFADCEGNFYILHDGQPSKWLRKYSPSGTFLQQWTVLNTNGWLLGGGLARVGDDVFSEYRVNQGGVPVQSHIVKGSLTSSQLNFNTQTPGLPQYPYDHYIADMASCASTNDASLPTIHISANKTTICTGEQVTYNASITNGGSQPSYQWLVNGSPITGANSRTLNYSPQAGDVVSCKLVSSDPCVSMYEVTSNQVTVDVTPGVTPQFSPIGELCQNSTPPILPGNSSNGISGTWSPATINTATVGATVYTFTPGSGQCASSVQITVNVVAQIIPAFHDLSLCVGEAPPALSNTSANGITGTWSPAQISTASPGTFTFTFTPNAGSCIATKKITVRVSDKVEPTFEPVGPFCLNQTPTALKTTSTNGFAGTWSPSQITTSTLGTFTYIFTPVAGSCATSKSITIQITDQIVPVFDPIGPFCLNDSSIRLPDTSANGISGQWSPDTINTSASGEYTHTFTPTASQCAGRFTVTVVVQDSLKISFTPPDELCINSVPFELIAAPAGGTWSGSGVTVNRFDPFIAGPGTHLLTYAYKNGQCEAISQFELTVKDEKCDLLVLTEVITPNNDGINDRLRFNSDEVIPDSEIWIFNRWSTQIYHTKNYMNNWDANGYPGGVYYYVLKIKDKIYKSTLTVVK